MQRTVESPRSLVVSGVARGDITPPVGIYHRMWGAATQDVSTGVHRPLTATVWTIRPDRVETVETFGVETFGVGVETVGVETGGAGPAAGDDLRVLIAVDHCLLWHAEMRSLIEKVAGGSGVPAESIVVFFSHTHGAGLMGMERQSMPGGEMIPPYLDRLAESLTTLVRQAFDSMRPTSIDFGTGASALAANRDLWDEELGQFVCGYNPERQADDRVIVGRVCDATGTTVMTLVNYACHPTTLAWENSLISPDYVGAMRQLIEEATGAPCFFIQGASGDVGPRDGFVGDPAVADSNGRQLGYAALAALESLPLPNTRLVYSGAVVSGATLGTWRHEPSGPESDERSRVWRATECQIDLPLRPDLPRRETLLAEQERRNGEAESAADRGDAKAARDARAMAERATRRLVRVGHLPEGDRYTYRVRLWRVGDAVWIPLNGEHYNVLQTELRRRFPESTLVIGTLANGSDVWYLPDASSYGKGLYQEEASILDRGSLERLIDAVSLSIGELLSDRL